MKRNQFSKLLSCIVVSAIATALTALDVLFVNQLLVYLLLIFSMAILLIHEFLTIRASSGQSLGLVSAIRKYGHWLSCANIGSVLSLSFLASSPSYEPILLVAVFLASSFFTAMLMGILSFICESACCFHQE